MLKPIRFIGFDKFEGFEVTKNQSIERYVKIVEPAGAWTEMVPSWNCAAPAGSRLELSIEVGVEGKWSKPYRLGIWTPDNAELRHSINGQKDETGDVMTDTLKMAKPAGKFRASIELIANEKGDIPKLSFVSFALSNDDEDAKSNDTPSESTPPILTLPERAQASYPNGPKICSPTTLSMILSYWSYKLGRPELDQDVPAVCDAVFDKDWPGTGNWPFNTAYAGSFPGIRAYVARLNSISELEEWIRAGVPVACSVAYDILRYGQRRRKDDGHLLALIGFDEHGDPLFNDPAVSEQIRQTYARPSFDKAWQESGRTVYLVYPIDWKIPANRGSWFDR